MGEFIKRHWAWVTGGALLLGLAMAARDADRSRWRPTVASGPGGGEPRSFRRGAWTFDHYANGELRAYLAEPGPGERWAGDYSVGSFPRGKAQEAAAEWAGRRVGARHPRA